MNFELFFSMSVWFARFPPDEPHACHLFLNRSRAGLPVAAIKGRKAIAVRLKAGKVADERKR